MNKVMKKKMNEEFKNKLENETTIVIEEQIKEDFERGCLNKVSSYANSVHNWRERSLRSSAFVF